MIKDVIDETPKLHSKYNPEKEAERYIAAQTWSIPPKIFVCTEPGESYIAKILKTLYPTSKIYALRYQSLYFKNHDCLFDDVWNPAFSTPLLRWLLDRIPEQSIQQTVFLPWKPSDQLWKDTSESTWKDIQSFLHMQMGVLKTRIFFGHRWISNMIKNALYARCLCSIAKTDRPILLAVSGPSLDDVPLNIADTCCMYTVSSALDALHGKGIIPDVCFSTDGGYWVTPYLRTIDSSTIISFPLEAMIPIEILQNQPVSILTYNSCLEQELTEICGIQTQEAIRNGTVSGTAALFAIHNTSSIVVTSGLDLHTSPGLPHARPHFQDSLYLSEHSRLHPFPTFLYETTGRSTSLSVYASWFTSHKHTFRDRLFRLAPCKNSISGIHEISVETITNKHKKTKAQQKITTSHGLDFYTRKRNLFSWLNSYKQKISDIQTLFELESDTGLCELIELLCYRDYLDSQKTSSVIKIKEQATKKIDELLLQVNSYEL